MRRLDYIISMFLYVRIYIYYLYIYLFINLFMYMATKSWSNLSSVDSRHMGLELLIVLEHILLQPLAHSHPIQSRL